MYKILFTHRSLKDLESINRGTQKRIAAKLKEYSAEPLKYSKKLINTNLGIYRFRIGDYRIIFDIDEENKEGKIMKNLKNIHPGDILKKEFLVPMGISVYLLSKQTGLSQTRLSQITGGKRSITAEMALKLEKFFDIPAEFWMNLQTLYDIEEARKLRDKELESIVPYQKLKQKTA
jgi:addiction module HigA family antidote